jgi:hypothetical protein
MEDIKIIVNELKEALKPYDFIQKGTSCVFFYDCGWYIIKAEIIQMISSGTSVITGIDFCWNNYNNYLGYPLRGDAHDGKYTLNDFSQITKENVCKWINTEKEYFLKTYKNPLDMLPYFKKYNDIHHQPHGYIISRIFKNKKEAKYFEDEAVHLLKEYNVNHSIYILPSDHIGEKRYRELENHINTIIKMNDREFVDEIIKEINERRKKFKLKILEKYF